MTESSSIAVYLAQASPLSPPQLKELWYITGRTTGELQAASENGTELYSAELFGRDHVEAVPRLEKTIDFCQRHDLEFRLEETYGGETETIDVSTLRAILDRDDSDA